MEKVFQSGPTDQEISAALQEPQPILTTKDPLLADYQFRLPDQ